ncbi:MAG: P-II family nitrogen regulator, partial [Pseudomonadota bacterium]
MEKLDQRIQLVASTEFSQTIDDWRRGQSDLPSRSEAIRRLVQQGLRYEEEFPMQMIIAIIRPHKYEALREELVKIGVEGITVTQVSGFGRQRGQTEIYRGAEYQTNEVPKLRLDIVVQNEILNKVLETIQATANRMTALQWR